MSDTNSNLHANAEPRRDSYGFAVRPQHLQRYREYGHIYKEEEEERSEKWSIFLEQCSQSAQQCIPVKEHLETPEAEAVARNNQVDEESLGEHGDSSDDKSASDSNKEAEAVDINTQANKGSLGEDDDSSGEKSTSNRSEKTEAAARNALANKESLGEHNNSIGETSAPDSSKEAEATARNTQADKESLGRSDGSSGEKSTSYNSKRGEAKKQVTVDNETKYSKVKFWAPLRQSLAPIESVMSVRVKHKVCVPKERVHVVQNHLPPIDEDTSEELTAPNNLETQPHHNLVVSEESDMDPQELEDSAESIRSANKYVESCEVSDIFRQDRERSSNSVDADETSQGNESSTEGYNTLEGCATDKLTEAKPFFPWREELESLVHGGVPKALRGEACEREE